MSIDGPEAGPSANGAASLVDSLSMWEATAGLPEQVAAAAGRAAAGPFPLDVALSNVVVLGMGGSGIAGDVLAAVAAPEMALPVSVVKSADAPAFVGPDTLVFAVSCSGDTEETLAATGAALRAGAPVVAITAGGRLADMVRAAGSVVIDVPPEIPQPRAALGAMAVPPLVVLEHLGLLEDVGARLAAAVDQLERRRDELVGGRGPAQAMARRIGRTFPLIHGSAGVSGVAAQRWKTQINENAKAPAFFSVLPELCHNEVAGWGADGDVTRQVFTLVSLRHDAESGSAGARFALVQEMMAEVVSDMIEVRASGQGALAQFFDLVLVGDFVSLHLAAHEGVDPGPVPALSEIKRRLASP